MKRTYVLISIGIVLFCTVSCAGAASSMPVVLVTGFAPFGNYTVNPSGLIAETLNGSTVAGALVVGVVLPVDYNESVEIALQAIQQYQPVLVISCGLNARAQNVHVEKIAVNLRRYDLGNGHLSFPKQIDVAGPMVRTSRLPVGKLVKAIREANLSAQQSFFAGMYVCNCLFYKLLKYAYEHNDSTVVGFLHVPLLDSQSPQGMALGDMVDTVTLVIQTSLASSDAQIRC
jgi:pyroglutamyl-peptidase